MNDISIPDGAADRLRGYGYKPNGTQVDTDALSRMIARLPGVSNDPQTLIGIRYILEKVLCNGEQLSEELRQAVAIEGRNDDNRAAGKGRKGKGRRRVTDVLPSL